MRALRLHLDCLQELDQDRRRLSRTEKLGSIAAAVLVTAALVGSHLLEQIARERLGAP